METQWKVLCRSRREEEHGLLAIAVVSMGSRNTTSMPCFVISSLRFPQSLLLKMMQSHAVFKVIREKVKINPGFFYHNGSFVFLTILFKHLIHFLKDLRFPKLCAKRFSVQVRNSSKVCSTHSLQYHLLQARYRNNLSIHLWMN